MSREGVTVSETRYELTHLQALEAESVHIFREVAATFSNPGMLFSGGKDSVVMLHLAAKAFWPAPLPFPLLHVDTGHNFAEVLEFRDTVAESLGARLIVAKVQDYIDDGRLVERSDGTRNPLQTQPLLDAIAVAPERLRGIGLTLARSLQALPAKEGAAGQGLLRGVRHDCLLEDAYLLGRDLRPLAGRSALTLLRVDPDRALMAAAGVPSVGPAYDLDAPPVGAAPRERPSPGAQAAPAGGGALGEGERVERAFLEVEG